MSDRKIRPLYLEQRLYFVENMLNEQSIPAMKEAGLSEEQIKKMGNFFHDALLILIGDTFGDLIPRGEDGRVDWSKQ